MKDAKDAVVRGRAMLTNDASFTEVMKFEAKLWLHKQEFQKRAQSFSSDGEKIRFLLAELNLLWTRAASVQQAVGLEISHFYPLDDFMGIYALSWNLEKLICEGSHTFLDIKEAWAEYISNLGALGYDLNPFDFGERCGRCAKLAEKLNGGFIAAAVIPLEDHHRARLGGLPPPARKLRMKQS
jgi:hypothetical protein